MDELVSPSRQTSLRRQLSTASHPLTAHDEPDGDVSRPALRRYTSETERHVAESSKSGSERGSLDLLRMSNTDEVEVLIHPIKPDESLAGIALLYGVELGTLRKTNKLWASDPIHLRTHIYVPLEACRWGKARETFYRDTTGHVVLTPKSNAEGTPRILEVIAMPRSQLHAYPRKPPERTSQPTSHHLAGPSIQNDLRTLPPPLAPHKPSHVVRLRPAPLPPPDALELRPRPSEDLHKKYN